MIQFRCTKKVLDYLGIKNSQVCEIRETDALLGNWYVNMLNIERRKTLIFMSENTFLSFILYGLKKENIEKLPNMFLGGLDQVLRIEGIDDRKIDFVINQSRIIEITKTDSRSLLGNLNDLVYLYTETIYHNGGLKNCDLTGITKNMNRTPQRNLGWGDSISKTIELLDSI